MTELIFRSDLSEQFIESIKKNGEKHMQTIDQCKEQLNSEEMQARLLDIYITPEKAARQKQR